MNTIEILKDTFKATGTYTATSGTVYETGTVDIDCGNQKLTVAANRSSDGAIRAAEFIGRYETSRKPWRVHLYTMHGRTRVTFGRDDRSSRFNKLRGISHEPETFWHEHPNPAFYGR